MRNFNNINNFNNNAPYRFLGEGNKVSEDSCLTKLNNNDLIIGGSGSGKTTGYVSPLLNNLCGSSLVVQDTKGRLCRTYSKILKTRGFMVYTLDFCNPSQSSIGYNPLAAIRRHPDGSVVEQDVNKLAALLAPLSDTILGAVCTEASQCGDWLLPGSACQV
jgi:type IV secretion system protein VirD4